MGYYTTFSLEIVDGPTTIQDSCPECNSPDTFNALIIDTIRSHHDGIDYSLSQEDKWYGHEEEMQEISTKYPETTFKLRGEGEENADVWVKFFKNGKVVTRRVDFTIDETIKDSDFD